MAGTNPAPKSTATGKPPPKWTDTKNTTLVKTSQGGKMMAKGPAAKPQPKGEKGSAYSPPPLKDQGYLYSAPKSKGLNSKLYHRPAPVKPLETDSAPAKPLPVKGKHIPTLISVTRDEKVAMTWAPKQKPEILGMEKKGGQIVLKTSAGEKKYPSGTPARREGDYLYVGKKPAEDKFYYPEKKAAA